MTAIQHDHAASWQDCEARARDALWTAADGSRSVLEDINRWQATEDEHLIKSFSQLYSPNLAGLATTGAGVAKLFPPFGSWLISEIASAVGVAKANQRVAVAAETQDYLARLVGGERLSYALELFEEIGVAARELGQTGGRISAFFEGASAKTTETQRDVSGELRQRLERDIQGGENIDARRLGDFDTHVGMEIEQADEKVREYHQLRAIYEQRIIELRSLGERTLLEGARILGELKDKFLQFLVSQNDDGGLKLIVGLDFNPRQHDLLMAKKPVSKLDCYFVIKRTSHHLEGDATAESASMRAHVGRRTLSQLRDLGIRTTVSISGSGANVQLSGDGRTIIEGSFATLGRYGIGMLEGESGATRDDVARQAPIRGKRVADAVVQLLEKRGLDAAAGQEIRKI